MILLSSFLLSFCSIHPLILHVNAFIPPSSYSYSSFHHHQPQSPSPTTTTTTKLNEAPVPFAGVGPRSAWTSMSKYNLPSLDLILNEWTANLIPKNINENLPERVELGVSNNRELFVDTIIIELTRSLDDMGLGIELQEIRGGREDGLGITVISGLVEGGLASEQLNQEGGGEGDDIMVGDSISSVSIVQQKEEASDGKKKEGGGLKDLQTVITAQTECLNYESTVQAISSLPPPTTQNPTQTLTLTLKRVRRKPIINVNLRYPPSQNEPDTTIQLFAGENLRLAMLVRGIKLNDPLAQRFDTKSGGNCGAGGLCRTCAVSVLRGGELLNPQKLAEEQMLKDDTPKWRLACKAFVGYGMKEGDMTVQVNPRQW